MSEISFPKTFEALTECMKFCGICSEKSIDDRLDCHKHCQGCVTLCSTMMNWIILNTNSLDIKCLGKILEKTCNDCANMCKNHSNDHCQKCSKSCEKVATSIREEMKIEK